MTLEGNEVGPPSFKAQALSQDSINGLRLQATLFISNTYFFLNWITFGKDSVLNMMETLMLQNLTMPQG